jgi:hypothetical protein
MAQLTLEECGTLSESDRNCELLLQHPLTVELLKEEDNNNGPVVHRGRTLPGLTNKLRSTFYPDYTPVGRKEGESGIKKGIMVHRQLYHMIECIKRNECRCDTKTSPNRLNIMTKNAFTKFEEIHFTPIASEVPVVCSDWGLGTRLDIVGYLWHGTKKQTSCIVSIKTGYNIGKNTQRHEQTLEVPYSSVKSTPSNHNQLQALAEHTLVKLYYEISFRRYIILYLHKDYDKVEVHEPASWWGDNSVKRRFYDALR